MIEPVTAKSPDRSWVVATPKSLADSMVRAIGDSADINWLDPCVGTGPFVQAMRDYGVRSTNIDAYDIEQTPAVRDQMSTVVRGCDYVSESVRSATRGKYNRIVANPPFVPIGQLPAELREVALKFGDSTGHHVTAGTNYWVAFLWRSMEDLIPGGSLAYVLPSSWEFADYAEEIRTAVSERFARVEVHRAAEPLFDGVLEGTIVLICRNYQGPNTDGLIKYSYQTAKSLIADFGDESQAVGRDANPPNVDSPHNVVLLRDVIRLRIGAVTGNTKYFLMSEERRRQLRLPVGAMTRVVSRAKHLCCAYLDEPNWNVLKDEQERIWMFRPSQDWLDHDSVRIYLDMAPDTIKRAPKDSHIGRRASWFRVNLPESPQGFLSGMSRHGPFLVSSRVAGLTATNTLYVANFLRKSSPEEQAAWGLALLARPVRSQLQSIGRRYAGGLVKYEPSDLRQLRLPVPEHFSDSIADYETAISHFRNGDLESVDRIVDRHFQLASTA